MNKIKKLGRFSQGWKVAFFALSLLWTIQGAQALHLNITNRNYINPVFQPQADASSDAMETQFNNLISSPAQIQDFLGALGAANATSGRSILSPGVSLQSNLLVAFSASGALGLGSGASLSNGISIPTNSLPPIGVGAKTGLTVAASGKVIRSPFRGLDPNRVMLHASFFTMDLSQYLGRGISMKSMQMGVGMSYEVYGPKPWTPLIRYNGIRLSSGLSYNTFDASYRTPFNLTQTNGAITTTWNNNIDIGVSSKVFSLATDAVTGFRLLYLLNLYAGLGLDLNFGSSSITGGSSGPVSGSAAAVQVYSATGTVSTDPTDSAGPPIAQLRFLLGTQIDIGSVGVYLQGTVSTPSVYAVHLGARATF